mmetsp:Transcript_10699/g.31903  ORF Transcript_10699/g.31903 Transcript_10699/m.31903 type:complete len:164 (+) Transcript_10699:177-668(+)|eukprot:CAMPEP_0119281030 /NCGR_PEP_ID=MMETSP1329-20130426/23901_1 /TAXON_ID=114041 /ORGANISM="Genus nov. species nov., Strain RCC1024" /LENGTH=163 /DNA_ID=CAMNT_0007281633 /DNA_START=112 /DNA_END=603 /DNA_ORIENTATION=-
MTHRNALLHASLLCLATAFVRSPAAPRRATRTRYVPEPVDPSVIAGQLVVIGASGAAGLYWWRVTVPQKRVEVARSKRSGEIAELLDELEEADAAAEGRPTAGDRRVERWLLTDWRNPEAKDPALPFLPKAKFNSGDNPILAAGALILAAGVANALGERVFAG